MYNDQIRDCQTQCATESYQISPIEIPQTPATQEDIHKAATRENAEEAIGADKQKAPKHFAASEKDGEMRIGWAPKEHGRSRTSKLTS